MYLIFVIMMKKFFVTYLYFVHHGIKKLICFCNREIIFILIFYKLYFLKLIKCEDIFLKIFSIFHKNIKDTSAL